MHKSVSAPARASRTGSRALLSAVAVLALSLSSLAADSPAAAPEYYHLRQGVVFYVANPKGADFQIAVDLKDINTFCQGAQTALVKVYDPDGAVLFDEDIPDDGIEDGGYDQAWSGWDHEMWARGALREAGAEPLFRWDAFTNPRKIDKIEGAVRTIAVKKAKKGVYQIQLAGCDDHFVKLRLAPALKYGVLGHPDFVAGHGDQFRTSYLCVPPMPYYNGDEKLLLWVIEHQYPRTRKLTLFNGSQPVAMTVAPFGGATNPIAAAALTAGQGLGRAELSLKGIKPGTVLKLVNEGAGDFMIRINGIPGILCPDEETARFIGGGLQAVDGGPAAAFPFQKKLWDAVKGLKKEDFNCGVKPGEWFKPAPEELQKITVHTWGATHALSSVDTLLTQVQKSLDQARPFTVMGLFDDLSTGHDGVANLALYYLYPFKGNQLYHNPALRNIITLALVKEWFKFRPGEVIFEWGELNVAYAEGFHWDWWEPIWDMKEALDPAVLSAFQEGVGRIAERLYYANALELVLSNGRTTIPLNLYHAYLITGDPKFKDLSKRYLKRMMTALDGPHSGRSPSGYFREHFGPDGGYCTYPLYQLGRLYALSGDPDVFAAVDQLCRWICYVTLPRGDAWTGPTSWQARINAPASEHMWGNGYKFIASKSEWAARLYRHFCPDPYFYNLADPLFEPGQPVPDKKTMLLTYLTRNILPAQPLPAEAAPGVFTDVGDGHEFFSVRRGKYYALVYAGKRVPFWMDWALGGANNYNGGGLTGLSIAGGPGAVLMGRVRKEYGWPIEAWDELSVPVTTGEMADGRFFNTGVSRNQVEWNAGQWTIRTTGEAVTAPVNYERSYRFDENAIAASVRIWHANLDQDVTIYRHYFEKTDLTIKSAWEIIPCVYDKDTKVICLNAAQQPMGELGVAPVDNVQAIQVNVGKGGVRIELDKPRTVKLSQEKEHKAPSRGIQIKMAEMLKDGQPAEMTYRIVL